MRLRIQFLALHTIHITYNIITCACVQLREVTGSFGLAIISIVLLVKALTYPLNYKVYASQVQILCFDLCEDFEC